MAGGGIKQINNTIRGGADGATFIPRYEGGYIRWSNNKGYNNPPDMYIKGEDGRDGAPGRDGATGAKLISQVLVGQDENGGNIYLQTFDDGTTATFVAPKGDKGDGSDVDISGKLDKHTGSSPDQDGFLLYGVDDHGAQVMVRSSYNDIQAIPRYSPNGTIISNEPQEHNDLATKHYVDITKYSVDITKLDKITEPSDHQRVYSVDETGAQDMISIDYSNEANEGNIPRRNSNLSIYIPNAPEEATEAVNKEYVDGELGDIDTALDEIINIQDEIISGKPVVSGSKLYRHNIHLTDTWGLDVYFEVINRDPTDYSVEFTYNEEEDATDFREECLAFLTHRVSAFGTFNGDMISTRSGAVTGLEYSIYGFGLWGEFRDYNDSESDTIFEISAETRWVDAIEDTVTEV